MRRTTILFALAAIIVTVALGASGWSFYDRFSSGRQLSLSYCLEIENLKKAQRDEATKSFKQLDATLRLLHIKKTPEIVRVARENRDSKLRRFAARPCPRPQT